MRRLSIPLTAVGIAVESPQARNECGLETESPTAARNKIGAENLICRTAQIVTKRLTCELILKNLTNHDSSFSLFGMEIV